MTGAKVDRTSSGEPHRIRPWAWPALALGLATAACGEDPAPRAPRAAPGGVTVRVEDRTGAPVADAYVIAEVTSALGLDELRRGGLLSAKTDAKGMVLFADLTRSAEYRLQAAPVDVPAEILKTLRDKTPWERLRFEPVVREGWRPHDDVIRVDLNPTVILRAVDARDGKTPVPGAEFDIEDGPSNGHRIGVADAKGTFRLVLRPGEAARLQARAMGSMTRFEPAAWTEVKSDAKEIAFPLDLEPRRIRVRLVNRSRSELRWSVRGPKAEGRGGRASATSETVVTVDVDALEPDGTYEVRFWEDGPDGGAATLEASKPSEAFVTLRLESTYVRGRLAGAVDLAGAKVDAKAENSAYPLEPRSTPIGEDGRFVFRMPPGTWIVGATAKGKKGWIRVEKKVQVADEPKDLELTLE